MPAGEPGPGAELLSCDEERRRLGEEAVPAPPDMSPHACLGPGDGTLGGSPIDDLLAWQRKQRQRHVAQQSDAQDIQGAQVNSTEQARPNIQMTMQQKRMELPGEAALIALQPQPVTTSQGRTVWEQRRASRALRLMQGSLALWAPYRAPCLASCLALGLVLPQGLALRGSAL